jgi:hypothetical protein
MYGRTLDGSSLLLVKMSPKGEKRIEALHAPLKLRARDPISLLKSITA